MLEIPAQADVDISSVIQYIIKGVPDNPVNKTVLHGAKTIRELKERFIQYDAIKKERKSKTKQSKPEEKRVEEKQIRRRRNDALTVAIRIMSARSVQ